MGGDGTVPIPDYGDVTWLCIKIFKNCTLREKVEKKLKKPVWKITKISHSSNWLIARLLHIYLIRYLNVFYALYMPQLDLCLFLCDLLRDNLHMIELTLLMCQSGL